MNPQDYPKSLGRDGSYVECDVQRMADLIALAKTDRPFVKMLVLKFGRLELSDVKHLEALQNFLKQLDVTAETTGMSSEQIGFYLFRKIFEAGLNSFSPTYARYEKDPNATCTVIARGDGRRSDEYLIADTGPE